MLALNRSDPSPDDVFADTRMSFGDHIEELRKYLLRAIYGLLVVLFGGLILDATGDALNLPWLGLGRPMLKVITEPAEAQVRAFYARRNERALEKLAAVNTTPEEIAEAEERFRKVDLDLSRLSDRDAEVLRAAPVEIDIMVDLKFFEETFGLKPLNAESKQVKIPAKVFPAQLNYISNRGENVLGNRQFMKTQSAQEAMVVYFKVAILCSAVLASPWIFFQMWAFIAAGLYPSERDYVYKFLGPSIGLFLLGVVLCQFIVLPGAVKALIGFNDYVDLDPDIRLNEWLGFALMLPIVFGISFQTPLVMFFFNRLGTFSWEDYWAKWRYAVIGLAFFAALITPTPDAITMLYLFVPMFGLYLIGVGVCRFFPPSHELEDDSEEQVAV